VLIVLNNWNLVDVKKNTQILKSLQLTLFTFGFEISVKVILTFKVHYYIAGTVMTDTIMQNM